MSIWCSVLGHRAPSIKVWNDGLFFGHCPRCRDEIITSAMARRWRGLPSRVKVVWKPRGPHVVDWYEAIDAAPIRRRIRPRGAPQALTPAE